jgi:hypothetical protein
MVPSSGNLALEVGRDAWISSGKIKALLAKHIDLLAGNIGYSADELSCGRRLKPIFAAAAFSVLEGLALRIGPRSTEWRLPAICAII